MLVFAGHDAVLNEHDHSIRSGPKFTHYQSSLLSFNTPCRSLNLDCISSSPGRAAAAFSGTSCAARNESSDLTWLSRNDELLRQVMMLLVRR